MKPNLKHTLAYIGLKPDTADVYLACLASDFSTASDLAKTAKLARTVVYTHLEELESRGLITVSIENNAKKYRATDPGIIMALAEQQKTELQGIMPSLQNLYNAASSKKVKLRFYADIVGTKTFFEELINCKDKFYRVLGAFNDEEFIRTVGEKYSKDWTMRRIKLGVNHHSLRPQASKKWQKRFYPELTMSGPSVLRELRYAPESIKLPILIYLFDEKVAFVSGKLGNTYVAVLESKDVFDALCSVYDTIWAISEKVEISK